MLDDLRKIWILTDSVEQEILLLNSYIKHLDVLLIMSANYFYGTFEILF